MTWTVETSPAAARQLERWTARRRSAFAVSWIGDYRLICRIEDARCVVLALNIGHRREVYRDH